uniref:Uncharacterized protein n=1 Tax=Bacillus phage Lima TaxID=1260284 RepID=K7WMD7_9VIRU|nr:hypothetical protein [Bacillus phage Lima]
MDMLQAIEENPIYPFRVRFGDGQFFAKKKDEEEDEDIEEIEEDEEPKPKAKPKSKSEEDAPAWAQKLIDLVTPKAEQQSGAQQVPVPEAPPEPEEEEPEDDEEVKEQPKKKGFLAWFL